MLREKDKTARRRFGPRAVLQMEVWMRKVGISMKNKEEKGKNYFSTTGWTVRFRLTEVEAR